MTQANPLPVPYSIKRHGITLSNCDDEPVQTPGCIQAHGLLLALRASDRVITQVSENCERWTEEQLRPYHGKEVAWNLEGTQIVASADNDGDVFQAVLDAGYDPEQVVFSYVPYPDEVMFGGVWTRTETVER